MCTVNNAYYCSLVAQPGRGLRGYTPPLENICYIYIYIITM